MNWLADWENTTRETIRAWIEQTTGEGLSVADPLPDTLAVTAEALGLSPASLRIWIFDHEADAPPSDWTTASLVAWARRHDLAETPVR